MNGDQTLRIVFFGDSITAFRHTLRVASLRAEAFLAEEGIAAQVFNAGVGGNTTADGRKRFRRDVLDLRPDLVFIMFGTNDAAVDVWRGKSTPRVPLARYEANLAHMARTLRKRGARVVLMTPPPMAMVGVMKRLYDKPPYSDRGVNHLVESYTATVRRLASTLGTGLVDPYADFMQHTRGATRRLEKLLPDGQHPNQEGQDRIATAVGAWMRKHPEALQSASRKNRPATPDFIHPHRLSLYQRRKDGRTRVPLELANIGTPTRLEVRYRYCDPTRSRTWGEWQGVSFRPRKNGIRGSFLLPEAGWYAVQVRAYRNKRLLAIGSVNDVAAGDIFVTAGQSNFANHGESSQRSETQRVLTFDGKTWQWCNDPQPLCSGQSFRGTPFPHLGDLLAETFRIPVGFLCLAMGSSKIADWDPDAVLPADREPAPREALYPRCMKPYVPLLKPYGGCRAVLWHQGESDILRKTPPAEYAAGLRKLAARFRTDFRMNVPWMTAVVSAIGEAPTPRGGGSRAGQEELIASGDFLAGPDTDILGTPFRMGPKDPHFNNAGLRAHARLWFACLYRALYHSG